VFMVGRGCPFSCAYCFNHAFKRLYHDKGRFVRYRSAGNIIAEIKEVRTKSPFRTVYFQDDTFGLEKKWSLDFLNRYEKELGMAFICLLRADLTDEAFIKSLKSAGCQSAFFGVETGSQNLRTMILKKGVSDEQIFETAGWFKKYKIRFRTYNMFGLPDETLEDAFQTVRLNIKIKTDYPWSSLFQPFPGTQLGEYAREKNLIDAASCFEPSFFEKSLLRLPEKKEIENLHRLFFYAVKFPFLFPFIKKAIRWDLKGFYNLLFLLGYLWSFERSERISFMETVGIGMGNFRNFLRRNENCF
jgi:anaerobic magnesium-protoporphyrin IX monomethyl ester cyclase